MFKNLVTNELVKIWKKNSVRVLAALFILVGGLTMFSGSGSYGNTYDSVFYRYDYEYQYRDPDPGMNGYLESVAEEQRKLRDECLELGIKDGDWRFGMINSIAVNIDTIEFNKYLISGISGKEVSPADVQQLREEIKLYTETNARLWDLIVENDFNKYIEEVYSGAKSDIESFRSAAERLNSVDLTGKASEAEKENLRVLAANCKIIADESDKFFQTALNAGLKGVGADLNLIDGVKLELSGNYFPLISSEDIGGGRATSQLIASLASESESLKEKIFIAGYAVANGYDEMTTAGSSRVVYMSLVTGLFYSLMALFAIYTAGASVASEFSRKTINMLVIRPVSRRMITASKYVASLLSVFAVTFAGFVVCFLFAGLINGFSDFFQPYIYFNGTAAESVPYLVWFLGKALIGSLSFVFYLTLAFTVAMLIRSTTATIVVTYSAYVFSSLLLLLRSALYNWIFLKTGVELYKYLPLTYININGIVFEGVRNIGRSGYEFGDVLRSFNIISGSAPLGIAYGVLMITLMIALLYFIADRSFRKRDIK